MKIFPFNWANPSVDFTECPTPVGHSCGYCARKIVFGDAGVVLPYAGPSDPKTTDYCAKCGESPESGSHFPGKCEYVPPNPEVFHRKCFLMAILGPAADKFLKDEKPCKECKVRPPFHHKMSCSRG